MKKHRIGVIGAGAIAQALHIPGYAAAAHCELAAIADPSPARLREVRDKGWKFLREYRDYRDLLANEKPDAVSICTPNQFHAEIAIACLKAGADLLLEKPMALTNKEAQAIARTAQATGRRIMVGFSHRFNELNLAAKKALDSGKIGKPFMIRVRFAHTGPIPGWAKSDWFYKPELSGGGALMDMAVHAFDIAQWFISPATSVYAQTATLRKKIPVDDNVVAVLEFGESCMGYIECGWTSPAGFSGIEIMGDKGAICSDYTANRTTLTVQTTTASGTGKAKTTVLADHPKSGAWQNEMTYFTKQLATGKPFQPGIEAGLLTTRLVVAAYKSSQTGRKISLPSL
jgi:predicted dehydrogenase